MRTDEHRPADFDPSDYRVVDYLDNRKPLPPIGGGPRAYEAYKKYVASWQARVFEHFPEWKTGGTDHTSIYQCNHCGHPGIRWVAVVEQVSTGKRLAFGEICADRVELPGRDAFRAKFVKTQAEREQAHFEKLIARLEWEVGNEEIVAFLAGLDEEAHPFLLDMKIALDRYGSLTERQMAAVAKFKAGAEKFAAAKAEQAEALKDTPPLPEGKLVIEGEIVSHKFQESAYGTTLKMLVKLDDGNKVWGTMPDSIQELQRVDWDADGNVIEPRFESVRALHGQRIRFNATVTRSDNDEHFGFFKRPTKAEVVS